MIDIDNGLRESASINIHGLAILLIPNPTSAIHATTSLGFLIELEHAAALLAAGRQRGAARSLLLLLLRSKACFDRLQVGQMHLGGQLVWVACQYHPIEEGNAIGGGNRKRRRAVRREGVQRALGDVLGDAVDCAG